MSGIKALKFSAAAFTNACRILKALSESGG